MQEWKATDNFRDGAVKVAERRDKFVEEEFSTLANPKDNYNPNDIRNLEALMIIGFLNPIIHPEKPKHIISKWAATFLGATRRKITMD